MEKSVKKIAVLEFDWPETCKECPLSELWPDSSDKNWSFWCNVLDERSYDMFVYESGHIAECPLKVKENEK